MQIKPQAEFTPGSLISEFMILASTLISSVFMNAGIFYDKLSIKACDKTVRFVETYLYKQHTYVLLTNVHFYA